MNRVTIILIIILVGVVGMIVFNLKKDSFSYERFISKDAELNIEMDYLSGWRYSETRGAFDSYVEVKFIGPQRESGIFSAIMTVLAKRSSKVESKPANIDTMADEWEKGRLKFKSSKVISRSKTKIHNQEGIDLELSYMTLDKFDQLDAKLIPVKERIVIFKKDNKFYVARYLNIAEEFDKFDKAFYHCVKSINFKGL